MNPTPFKSESTPWRVQLPASLSPDRKRKARYFPTLEAAKKFCSAVKKKGLAVIDGDTAPAGALKEHAPLIMAAIAKLGGDPTKVFEAIEFFQKTKLNIKGGILADVADAFAEARRGKVAHRTWSDDNSRLKKLLAEFGNAPIADITEADLDEFFDGLPGHSRSIYKTVNVFFGWARKKGFIAIDPIANLSPAQRWNARKDIYPVATFERMLRIAAGLEGVRVGDEPTRDFLPLLPWMIISGFCGLRSCEAFRTKLTDDAIRWSDLYFDRGFIHIRHDVAKRTKRVSDKRNIETSTYVEAARAWLTLVPRESEFIVTAIERTLGELKTEFQVRTGIKFLGNAFRNSFASYALTTEGRKGVGALALEMGNSEAICKQFYVETLEPRIGAAWFGLRPDQPANVVPIAAVAA
jgi:hypothetical protein